MQLNAITRKSALMAILLLIAILVAAVVRYSLAPFEVELADSPFRGRIVSLVLATLIFVYSGVIAGKMLPRSGLCKAYSTLPIPIYGVLACGVVFAPAALSTAVASLCFAVALHLLLRSLHNAGEKDSVFFASLLLGSMVLLSPPCLVLALVIPIAIVVLALSFRQALLMLVGYMLPLLGASYVVWYRGDELLDFGRNLRSALLSSQMAPIENIPYLSIVLAALVVVLLIWGLVYATIRPDKMFLLARVRRALHFFVWVTLLSLFILFIPSCNLSVGAIIAVPVTILLSFVLGVLPNNHSTVAYWVLLALFVAHLFVA